MKIKFWDRVILFFGALLTILAGALLFITGLQVQGTIGEALPLGLRIACIALGILTAAFGGYLFVFPRKFAYRKHDFVVQQTENGEVRIAVKAIENLVQKCIDTHEEVRVVSMKIRNGRDGVTVDLCISLANNISIPLAVASLQKQIKQYLVASSGIEVKEVRVSVETAQTLMDAAPYLAEEEPQETSEEAPAPEKAAEADKPKLSLHQRIFGRPEQPLTMPQPLQPAAEDAAEEETQETDAPSPEAEDAEPGPEGNDPEAPEKEDTIDE